MNLYFLGGGNMASAIVSSLVNSPDPFNITVIEHNAEKRQKLMQDYAIQTSTTMPELNSEDILILAVKPQTLEKATSDLVLHNALVLSLAAGIDLSTLSRYLKGHTRIIRTMPNTPAQIGLGVTALYAPETVSSADKKQAQAIMSSVGQTIWLEQESQIHDITCISGSGPAYVFYLMNALYNAAKKQDFSKKQAYELTLATFKGAVMLAEKTQLDFQTLQDNVTSKGGTTFEALQTFQEHKLADIIEAGVEACKARSEEMQQQFHQE